MKRRFKITKAVVGDWSTGFSIHDLDHKNHENSMGEVAFFHHIGRLAGLELEQIAGLEFVVELKENQSPSLDPLDLCGKTIGGKSYKMLEG